MNKDYLTLKEAAEYTRYSVGGLRRKLKNKEVPCYQTAGGKILFRKDDLVKWIASCKV